jgi:hypothetical protein
LICFSSADAGLAFVFNSCFLPSFLIHPSCCSKIEEETRRQLSQANVNDLYDEPPPAEEEVVVPSEEEAL